MSGAHGSQGLIGARLPRPGARRLATGRGRYTDDISLPRMVHVAFVRSPLAHARIKAIETDAAAAAAGVVRVFTGREVAAECQPFRVFHGRFPKMRAPLYYPMAVDKAVWQGEAVVAIVAETRAEAEDAAELVEVEYDELAAVADPEAALSEGAPVIHDDLGTNEVLDTTVEGGDVDAAFAAADEVVEETFRFNRQTGVPLEPRSVLADYNPADGKLSVFMSHQTPHEMADVLAAHLGLGGHKVQVTAPDVGGAFGIKLQVYGDEVATCAIAKLMGRPVKFTADRLEAFVTDIHAREHRIKARMALSAEGDILALEVDDLCGIGAYSQFPRTSTLEGVHVIRLAGVGYKHDHFRGRLRIAYQNKNLAGHYRGVGVPIANAVTEHMVDKAARALGIDPVEMRRRNYVPDDGYPRTAPTGFAFDYLSLHPCLAKLEEVAGIAALRAEQARLRDKGIYRGIGIATFVETTGVSPDFYGPAEIRVSSQDGCTVRLEPSGHVRCLTSVTDQGQGTAAGVAQVAAEALGVGLDDVEVVTGDSAATPYGSGAWASRGMSIGGETVLLASRQLKRNILKVAAAALQQDPEQLDVRNGDIVDAAGTARMTLAEVARFGHFRQDLLPPDVQPELSVSTHHVPRNRPYHGGNGIQLSYLELDPETGFVKLLRHVVVHDCGRVINPLLVDEQIRGGVVQGIGSALFEECVYSEEGQMLNASLVDYLVPMASEVPDIEVAEVSTPSPLTELGAKGVGEAGPSGAPAAILNAINDALAPLGASIAELPATPERILKALGKV